MLLLITFVVIQYISSQGVHFSSYDIPTSNNCPENRRVADQTCPVIKTVLVTYMSKDVSYTSTKFTDDSIIRKVRSTHIYFTDLILLLI